MSKKKALVTILSVACFSVGCASSKKAQETDLDRTVRLQDAANTPSEIAQRGAQAFANAPGLTAEQSSKLKTIFSRTQA